MEVEAFKKAEYERLTAEERDRMNARLTIWTLFLTIIGAFGFLSTQGLTGMYVGALAPYVLMYLAQLSRHNEAALKQVRKYLKKLAKEANYEGYETWCASLPRVAQGTYLDALRNALLTASLLAICSAAIHMPPIWLPMLLADIPPLVFIWRWLAK